MISQYQPEKETDKRTEEEQRRTYEAWNKLVTNVYENLTSSGGNISDAIKDFHPEDPEALRKIAEIAAGTGKVTSPLQQPTANKE